MLKVCSNNSNNFNIFQTDDMNMDTSAPTTYSKHVRISSKKK